MRFKMKFKPFSKKPRSTMSSMRDPLLPAVSKVQLVVDAMFIRKCLRKRRIGDIKDVRWPEALKAIYRDTEKAENELKHIISVCQKALDEQIMPYKNGLWDIINKFDMIKGMDQEAERREKEAIMQANKA